MMNQLDRLGILVVGLFSAAAVFIGRHDVWTGVAISVLGASVGFLAWGDRLVHRPDAFLAAIPPSMVIIGFLTFRIIEVRYPTLAWIFAGLVGSVTTYTLIRLWRHCRTLWHRP